MHKKIVLGILVVAVLGAALIYWKIGYKKQSALNIPAPQISDVKQGKAGDDFPKELIFIKNTKINNSFTTQFQNGKQLNANIVAPGDLLTIYLNYVQELVNSGYGVINSTVNAEAGSITAKKDAATVTLLLTKSPKPGETIVAIGYNPAK